MSPVIVTHSQEEGAMERVESREFDTARYLDSDKMIAEYLAANLEDPDMFLAALGNAAKTKGVAQLAEDTGLSQESLDTIFSPGMKPDFQTILKILKALEIQLSFAAKKRLPSQILQQHRAEVLEIMTRYPRLSNLRIIGSVARGDDTIDSDIDFVVDPLPGATLFDFGGFQDDLTELLGVPVNVISSRGRMDEYMRESIEREAVNI